MARVPKLLDVTVPMTPGMPVYPGNPAFELTGVKRIAEGGSSNVSRVVCGTHTGTHLDAPKHFFDDGAGVDELPLNLLLGRARVVEITRRGGIGRQDLEAAGLRDSTTTTRTSRNPGRAISSSRGSRSSASITSPSRSSRRRGRRHTARCCRRAS
jgi:kynurenine formamidase